MSQDTRTFEVPAPAWDRITGAVMGWRHDYDRAHRRVFGPAAAIPRPGDDQPIFRDLYDASETIKMGARAEDAARAAGRASAVRLFENGPNYVQAVAAINAGRMRNAAGLLEADLNDPVNRPAGGRVQVEPSSLRVTAAGIEYIEKPPAPPMPQSPYDAVRFFIMHGNIGRGEGDDEINRMLASRASAGQIRAAAMSAASKGFFPHANQAALILAQHYGYEASDVNPFPDNSSSPWVDTIPVPVG